MTVNEISNSMLLQPESVYLDDDDIRQASSNSLRVADASQQWNTYLNGLAVLGLQQWLRGRLPDVIVDLRNSTLFQPGYSSFFDGVCNVQIGAFKVCVIAVEHVIDGIVAIPQAAVEMPALIPHFYILVEVLEELEELVIRGTLRHDYLSEYRNFSNFQPDQDWVYRVPLPYFERQPDRIAFYAQYLNPAHFSLSSQVQVTEPSVNVQLESIIDRLQLDIPLWQQLTWEQATAILNSPNLLTHLHRHQTQNLERAGSEQVLQDMADDISQMVVNVAQWLEAELDSLSQSLGFMTIDQFQPAMAMRSLRSPYRFDTAIETLRNGGLPIPETVRPIYRNIKLANLELCVCLIPFLRANTLEQTASDASDWSLLVIVGSRTEQVLPVGLQLQISNPITVLEAHTLEFEDTFLYSLVDASLDDRLQVTLIAPNGLGQSLPLLTFDLGER